MVVNHPTFRNNDHHFSVIPIDIVPISPNPERPCHTERETLRVETLPPRSAVSNTGATQRFYYATSLQIVTRKGIMPYERKFPIPVSHPAPRGNVVRDVLLDS